ncbi:hypothetical protein [Actinopolymorpha pittospori]
MGKTVMGAAAVSLDGFITDDHDGVGPMFDWLGNGAVAWAFEGSDDQVHTTLTDPIPFGNPSRVVQGDRVTHLVYDVIKQR